MIKGISFHFNLHILSLYLDLTLLSQTEVQFFEILFCCSSTFTYIHLAILTDIDPRYMIKTCKC